MISKFTMEFEEPVCKLSRRENDNIDLKKKKRNTAFSMLQHISRLVIPAIQNEISLTDSLSTIPRKTRT